jgi:hypothetical protein
MSVMQGPWYTFEEAQELLSFNRSELLHEIDNGSIRPVVTTKQRLFLVFKRDEDQHWLGLGVCRYRGCLTLHPNTILSLLEQGEVYLRNGSGRFLELQKVTEWQSSYPFKQPPPFGVLKKWEGRFREDVDLSKYAVTPLPEERRSNEAALYKMMDSFSSALGSISDIGAKNAPKRTLAEEPYMRELAAKAEARPVILDFKTNSLFKKEDLRIAVSEIERFKTAIVSDREIALELQPVAQATSGLEGKRTNQLHQLFLRALEANPSAKTKQLWSVIQEDWESDSPLYDSERIITNMDEFCVEWRSDYYNDQAFKRSSFGPVLSKLKKQV